MVVCLGLVNWLLTVLVTSSSLFAPIRLAAAEVHPKLGELTRCPLCAGVWLGWFEAFVLGGPIPSRGLGQVFWNGLLYKAVGELVAVGALSLTAIGMGAQPGQVDHQVAQGGRHGDPARL
jgi:hypothetical protein